MTVNPPGAAGGIFNLLILGKIQQHVNSKVRGAGETFP